MRSFNGMPTRYDVVSVVSVLTLWSTALSASFNSNTKEGRDREQLPLRYKACRHRMCVVCCVSLYTYIQLQQHHHHKLCCSTTWAARMPTRQTWALCLPLLSRIIHAWLLPSCTPCCCSVSLSLPSNNPLALLLLLLLNRPPPRPKGTGQWHMGRHAASRFFGGGLPPAMML